MTKLGLTITINKFTTYFESKNYFLLCDTIDDAKNKLIEIIVDNFKYINIDFPDNLVDFEYQWFNKQYVNASSFTYNLFHNDNWSSPWDNDEIYDDVLVKLEEYEIQNAPDFSQMYGEPDPDSNVDDKFSIEHNEQTHEFESKLKEIISQSQNVKLKDDEIKDCPCDKCKEGYVYQKMKKELDQELSQELTQELSQELTQQINQKLNQKLTQESIQELNQESSQESSQELNQELNQESSQESSQELLDTSN